MNWAETQECAAEVADVLRCKGHVRVVADPKIALRAQGIDLCGQSPQPCVTLQGLGLPAPLRGGDDGRLPLAQPELMIAYRKGGEIERAAGFGEPADVGGS